MNEVEIKIFNDIINLIKDNLQLLIINHDSCLYYLNNYCNKIKSCDLPINQDLLIKFTEEALYALISADFLYDCKEGLE